MQGKRVKVSGLLSWAGRGAELAFLAGLGVCLCHALPSAAVSQRKRNPKEGLKFVSSFWQATSLISAAYLQNAMKHELLRFGATGRQSRGAICVTLKDTSTVVVFLPHAVPACSAGLIPSH